VSEGKENIIDTHVQVMVVVAVIMYGGTSVMGQRPLAIWAEKETTKPVMV
jgi:hypothetical protein